MIGLEPYLPVTRSPGEQAKSPGILRGLIRIKLIDAAHQIYQFFPKRCKFLKPAKLAINFQNTKRLSYSAWFLKQPQPEDCLGTG